MILLSIYLTLIFLHSLVSARLERTMITAPMAFTVAGMATFWWVPGVHTLQGEGDPGVFLHVAEIGLVLLLFTDASRTRLAVLKSMGGLPIRLLSVGMLLTIALGLLGALGVFPGLTLWEAGILAAILAPTDAGLGQVIVNSPRVPTAVRQALNVEAGLNDGLSVPFLLFFIALAGPGAAGERVQLSEYILEQLGIGSLVGLGIGLLGGSVLGWAHRRQWMAPEWRQLGVVTLPLVCLLAADRLGASMFIAAFVAGLCVQVGFREAARHSVEFTEEWGQLLNLAVFFLFGVLVARAWPQLEGRHLVYAVLSLTVVRMVPVAISLIGSRLHWATVGFMGWFGPRGLASIVLGLVYLEETSKPTDGATIQRAVMVTVLLSVFGHGLSAQPGMKWYARKTGRLPKEAPEFEDGTREAPGHAG